MRDAPFSGFRPLISLSGLVPALFQERLSRFVGRARLGEQTVDIHIADPGRLEELLYSGNEILIRRAPEGSGRKTKWSLMAGRGQGGWILLNTFLHRSIAERILSLPEISPFGKLQGFRAEVSPPSMKSRFDFLLDTAPGEKLWLEVKGCSLRKGSTALFPDAPTSRGTRHLRELSEMALRGERCAVMFLVFPWGVECFSPNGETDPDFFSAFREAAGSGVSFHPVHLYLIDGVLHYRGMLPLCGFSRRSPR